MGIRTPTIGNLNVVVLSRLWHDVEGGYALTLVFLTFHTPAPENLPCQSTFTFGAFQASSYSDPQPLGQMVDLGKI